jgi:PIN domain nuclease of toxin-antitoxin system
MNYLIDTQAVIWWLAADRRLSVRAKSTLERAGQRAVVSVASIWESSIKAASGRLKGPDLRSAVIAAGIPFLVIDDNHAKLAGELPDIHRDPFDRMLVAQAMIEHLVIITSDTTIPSYGVSTIW